jgi:Uma2 family endonuclease
VTRIMVGERGVEIVTIARVQPHDDWLRLDLSPLTDMSEDDFFRLCQANSEIRFERSAAGEIVVMPPECWESGRRGAEVLLALGTWAKADGTGVVTGSSAGYTLPDGAVRAPDASWTRRDRLAARPPGDLERFVHLCPDFVIEVRSPSDSLHDLLVKMDAYTVNGARLGWLIDPRERAVHVYRPGVPPERLDHLDAISADPELPGFVLDLAPIWRRELADA